MNMFRLEGFTLSKMLAHAGGSMEKPKKVKEEKKIKINVQPKSLMEAQKQLEKLRPLKEKILNQIKKIDGFGSIVLGKKLKIVVLHEIAKNQITEMIDKKHQKLIDFVLVGYKYEAKKSRKPVVGNNF